MDISANTIISKRYQVDNAKKYDIEYVVYPAKEILISKIEGDVKTSYNNETDDILRLGFTISDPIEFILGNNLNINTINEIEMIYIMKNQRRQGIGSRYINDIISEYPDDLFILTSAAIKEEYTEDPSDIDNERILFSLSIFFSKLGFVNTNKYIGCYELQKVYLYTGNNSGRKFVDFIINTLLS